jgi:hypothetical protein
MNKLPEAMVDAARDRIAMHFKVFGPSAFLCDREGAAAKDALTAAGVPQMLACVEALRGLSAMYAATWDSVDGSLFMDGSTVDRFEEVHETAGNAIRAFDKVNK